MTRDEAKQHVREGLCRTLPGALWFLATDHRQGRGEVPGLWRPEEGVCAGAVPEVSARVVRGVFVSRPVRLPELPPEAGAGENRLGGPGGVRRSGPQTVRVHDSQTTADRLPLRSLAVGGALLSFSQHSFLLHSISKIYRVGTIRNHIRIRKAHPMRPSAHWGYRLFTVVMSLIAVFACGAILVILYLLGRAQVTAFEGTGLLIIVSGGTIAVWLVGRLAIYIGVGGNADKAALRAPLIAALAPTAFFLLCLLVGMITSIGKARG